MISPECDITRYCYYDISSNAMYYITITSAITIASVHYTVPVNYDIYSNAMYYIAITATITVASYYTLE